MVPPLNRPMLSSVLNATSGRIPTLSSMRACDAPRVAVNFRAIRSEDSVRLKAKLRHIFLFPWNEHFDARRAERRQLMRYLSSHDDGILAICCVVEDTNADRKLIAGGPMAGTFGVRMKSPLTSVGLSATPTRFGLTAIAIIRNLPLK